MDIRHFRHFLAVADELHFGRAAKRLNMEQAPLSQSIKRFEEELGVTLFERSRRGGTHLSPAGARMFDEARQAVSQFDHTISVVRGVGVELEEPISVGFVTASLLRILPAALEAFHAEYQAVDVRLKEGGTADLIDHLAAGTLDLVLTNTPTSHPSGIEFELLRSERTIVALPRAHPLATKKSLSLKDLADQPLVFFPRQASPDVYDGIMASFDALSVVPRIRQEASYTPTILSLVASGLGYALVQESAAALADPKIVFRVLADLPSDLTWNLHLGWEPSKKPPSVHAFAGYLRDSTLTHATDIV